MSQYRAVVCFLMAGLVSACSNEDSDTSDDEDGNGGSAATGGGGSGGTGGAATSGTGLPSGTACVKVGPSAECFRPIDECKPLGF
jgi:hypothetical protein